MAARYGSGNWAFQADVGAVERGEHRVGKKLSSFFLSFDARIHAVPIDGDPGGIHSANGGVRDFRSNSIAGYQGDLVGHVLL